MNIKKDNETGENKRKIEVVPYNPNWVMMYEEEAARIKKVMNTILINITHIGSTAIPGIKAKPVIDILVEVKDIGEVEQYNNEMEKLGYEPMGEYGIPGRRFFIKGGNNRTHHIHVFQEGNKEIERHLNFKEYLIAHPDVAKEYSKLKEKLAAEFTYDIENYVKGKSELIQEIDEKARLWKKS